MRARVLIVDDEETIRKLLRSRLEREGHEVAVACNADEADAVLDAGGIGLVITDLKMPGRDGFALMASLKQKHPLARAIVITGHGEKEVAVQALRAGASDYLEKPFDLDELSHSVGRCLREYQLERENKDLVERLEARVERVEGAAEDRYWFVSKDPSMEKVNEWLGVLRREAMRGEAEEPTVVIVGESGTGKEGIARMIHAGSRRGKGPWVALNCANFNEQLLESELFGHERGAFTGATTMKRGLFEVAQDGTLFLDEIGEMDVKLQAKILRVLQERTFRRVGGTVDMESDVRVIAATNRDLQAKVRDGLFREDLYHRLSRVVLELPALRERKTDVLVMARNFAERVFRSRGKKFTGFTPDAEASIVGYTWPGNVRELLNVVERSGLIHEEGPVGLRELSLPAPGSAARPVVGPRLELVKPPFTAEAGGQGGFMTLKKSWTDSFEREYLLSVLERNYGNVSAGVREAQLDRSNFLRLLRRHAIRAQEYRKAA